jgi:hypothetical protein
MAFGYQKPVAGMAAAPLGSGAFNVFTPMLEFFREYNDRYYTGVDNVADIAVLRTWASMAYSISAAYVPTTLLEQVAAPVQASVGPAVRGAVRSDWPLRRSGHCRAGVHLRRAGRGAAEVCA